MNSVNLATSALGRDTTISGYDGRESIVINRPQDHLEGPTPLRLQYSHVVHGEQLGWTELYNFQRKLGAGGQGVVFLADRKGSDGFILPVALKVFTPERYRSDPDYSQAMKRMAQVAMRIAQIQHDNLLDVHNFVSVDGIRVMEMEWIDGYDLQQLLTTEMHEQARQLVTADRWEYLNRVIVTHGETQPQLKPGIAIAILRDALGALGALHRRGIVHGDVKPSNIMLKRTGNVKLIDIGAAFLRDDPETHPLCTPAYAAPEVLEGGECTPRSDLASLGYVLIEVLTGRRAFAGLSDRSQMIEAKRNVTRNLYRSFPPEIASNDILMGLIQGLVAPNPENRYPTAEAADLFERGAAGFQRQLVKGNLATEPDSEIQTWLNDLDELRPRTA